MQLHNLQPTHKNKKSKRIGRGGKRGTFSGRGSKGQKSRSGTRIRPGFRGGDNPLWKLFPKKRGASKKTEIKHAFFSVKHEKMVSVSIDRIDRAFEAGETVSKESLLAKGMIRKSKKQVKILGNGELTKKLKFDKDLVFSKSASEKIQ